MMKRKYITTGFIVLMVLSIGSGVFAEDSKNASTSAGTSGTSSANSFFNVNDITQLFKQASDSAQKTQDRLQNIIKGADMMITNRITTLNALNTRIQGDTRLTTDEKTSLTTDVQNAINGLTTLKATIDADTDITKARADAKMVVTNFRIYEVLEPKLRLLVTINNLQTTSTNVGGLIPQIQNLINTLGGTGKDVSALNTLLTDISSQLTTVNTTLTADLAKVQGVGTTTTDPQSVFTGVRQDLAQIVRADFAKIRADFAQMRETFHQLILGSIKNATVSATPITSATPVPTATP